MKASFFAPVSTLAGLLLLAAAQLIAPHAVSHQPEGIHSRGHDRLHHWYKTLRQPFSGYGCCDGQDCRPTTARMHNRVVEVLVDGEWTRVPYDKLLKRKSPDLNTHVCAPKGPWSPKVIFCVVLGSGV